MHAAGERRNSLALGSRAPSAQPGWGVVRDNMVTVPALRDLLTPRNRRQRNPFGVANKRSNGTPLERHDRAAFVFSIS